MIYQKKSFLFVIMMLILTPVALLSQNSWQIEQVTNDNYTNNIGDVAVGSDGVLHIVYETRITSKKRNQPSHTDVFYITKSAGV